MRNQPKGTLIFFAMALALFFAASDVQARSCDQPRPRSSMGCEVSCDSESNRWVQKCQTCGTKPLPRAGCKVTECVDGNWEQECTNTLEQKSSDQCSRKRPIPRTGCRMECEEGRWQQKCPERN